MSTANSSSKDGRTVIITGASGGIGFELAKLFAVDGSDLVLISRDREKLEEAANFLRQTYGATTTTIAADLSQPGSPVAVFDRVAALGKKAAVLVNNAGFGVFGKFAESDLRTQLEVISLNIAALTHLTGLFLPGMIQRRSGRILNVASTAAFQPGPMMGVYYASKAYVLSFSSALSAETSGTGVTVTTLCPGPTRTNFQVRADLSETRLFNGVVMSATEVARAGYAGLQHGRSIVIPGMTNKLLGVGARILPRRVVLRFVQWLQENRR